MLLWFRSGGIGIKDIVFSILETTLMAWNFYKIWANKVIRFIKLAVNKFKIFIKICEHFEMHVSKSLKNVPN